MQGRITSYNVCYTKLLRGNLKINPTKVVCVGLNYKDHAKELNMEPPKEPIIFLKPVSSIIYNNDSIKIPEMSSWVEYEAELAIVIKKTCKSVKKEDAMEYIKGYTIVNDVTARDLQKRDVQWTRAKSFDTFCPIGPEIVSGIDPHNLKIQLRVNGELRQDSNTKNMIFGVEEIIEFVSSVMTLHPDDVISTGTPPGVGPIVKGDIVEVEIEKIGTLRNLVE